MYSIIEIGKPISFDEKSIIEYFVEGIPNTKRNESVLYQTLNLEELKEKILVYERIKGTLVVTNRFFNSSSSTSKGTEDKVKRDAVIRKVII